MNTPNRKPRLSDVARAAGVSLGTASNAFNRPQLLRKDVLDHIIATAGALGYAGPDPAGRLLMGGKAQVIGTMPPGEMPVSAAFRSPYFREFMLGVAEICDEHANSLIVIPGTVERSDHAIRTALVDGFILGQSQELAKVAARRQPVPVVMVDIVAGTGIPFVRIDGAGGARQAMAHLVDLGHRDIAILTCGRHPRPPILHPPGAADRRLQMSFPLDTEKLDGCARALAERGLSIDTVPVVEGFIPDPWCDAAAAFLLDHCPGITAVFAMSDRQAIALMHEAQRRGMLVPGDLSIVGFDDTEETRTVTPPLTTIHQDIAEKGRAAARILLDPAAPRNVVLPCRLVVRGSTAPPRRAAA